MYLSLCKFFCGFCASQSKPKSALLCTNTSTHTHTHTAEVIFAKNATLCFFHKTAMCVCMYTPATFQGAHWPCAIIWFWVISGAKNNYRPGIQISKRLGGKLFALKKCVVDLWCVCVCVCAWLYASVCGAPLLGGVSGLRKAWRIVGNDSDTIFLPEQTIARDATRFFVLFAVECGTGGCGSAPCMGMWGAQWYVSARYGRWQRWLLLWYFRVDSLFNN